MIADCVKFTTKSNDHHHQIGLDSASAEGNAAQRPLEKEGAFGHVTEKPRNSHDCFLPFIKERASVLSYDEPTAFSTVLSCVLLSQSLSQLY